MDLEFTARVWLAAPFVQGWLVVEQVHLGWTAVLEKTDDRPGAGTVLGGQGWIGCADPAGAEELGECETAEAACGAGEERAALDGEVGRVHSRYRKAFRA